MKKALIPLILLLLSYSYSQEATSSAPPSSSTGSNNQVLTAGQVINGALQTRSVYSAIDFINSSLPSVASDNDKRSVYIYLGTLQESISDYQNAKVSYINAARLQGNDIDGAPHRSNEMLVLDAVRCSLSLGEATEALTFLASSVRSSTDKNVISYVKLYEQWAVLSNSSSINTEDESIRLLKSYAKDENMAAVQKEVLFTLWYVTGESSYSSELLQKYPSSMEAGIVKEEVLITPAPFWYFLPKKEVGVSPTPSTKAEKSANKQEPPAAVSKSKEEVSNKREEVSGKIGEVSESEDEVYPKKQQLGLFRDKNNAINYVKKLSLAGFNAYIMEETRASGDAYFTVLVDEDEKHTVALRLKNAGFECYPLY